MTNLAIARFILRRAQYGDSRVDAKVDWYKATPIGSVSQIRVHTQECTEKVADVILDNPDSILLKDRFGEVRWVESFTVCVYPVHR